MHEFGHVLGIPHEGPGHDHEGLMADTLAPGVRRLPAADPDLLRPVETGIPGLFYEPPGVLFEQRMRPPAPPTTPEVTAPAGGASDPAPPTSKPTFRGLNLGPGPSWKSSQVRVSRPISRRAASGPRGPPAA